jgi:hypothetical protein
MSRIEIVKIIGRLVPATVQQTDTRFEVERNRLLDELMEPGAFETVALHEAGHEHYYKQAGGYDFTFVPPVVLFRRDNISKPFKKQTARIIVGDYLDRSAVDAEWFLKLAKGYAAGGETSRKLSPTRDRGEQSDLTNWNEMCADIYKTYSSPEVNDIAKRTWNDAQKAVRDELNDATLELTIRNRAKEIMPLLFPWLYAHDGHL